jgi:hypothetical protein
MMLLQSFGTKYNQAGDPILASARVAEAIATQPKIKAPLTAISLVATEYAHSGRNFDCSRPVPIYLPLRKL